MKKFFALLALVLGVVSCQTEPEGFDVNTGAEQDAVITVALPEGTRADSALGAFDHVNFENYDVRFQCEVHYNGQVKVLPVQISDNGKEATFPVRLIANRDYKFVVWADLVLEDSTDDLHYDTSDGLSNITLNVDTWVAMDETRDAFTCAKVCTFERGEAINLTLTRPFAKLRVITTDMEELMGIKPTWAKVEYATPYYTSFNAYEQKPYDLSSSGKTHSELFDIVPYGESGASKTLFTDYFFAINPENGQAPETVAFTMEVFDENGATIDEPKVFNTSIPVKRNYVTTIKGNILTYADHFTVEIKDAFANADNVEDAPYHQVAVTNGADLLKAIAEGREIIALNHIVATTADANFEEGTTRSTTAINPVLNLNGFTVTFVNDTDEPLITVAEGNSLTIVDEKGTGAIVLKGDGTAIENNGTLNIEGGSVGSNGNGTVIVNNGEANIEGANLNEGAVENKGTTNVNGGEVADGAIENTEDAIVGTYVYTADELAVAINACVAGLNNEVSFGANIVGDVTVIQKQGVKLTINGRGYKYNGTIKVHSNSNYYADAALTIKKVNFETATASTNVIEALENGSQRYSNNITVEDCTFTATDDAVNTSVAVQVKATRGVTVKNCTANNMHSLIQAQSCNTGDVKVENCTVNGKNGVAFKQVKSAVVEGTTITALEYGIRYDGNIDNYGIVVKNNNVTAKQPFIVRKMTGKNNTIAIEGKNTFTTNEPYNIVITNGSDDEAYVVPTGTYTLTGAENYVVFPYAQCVSTGEELVAAMQSSLTSTVILANDITMAAKQSSGYGKAGVVVVPGKTINGNGKTLKVTSAGDTWDCAICAKGGTIKNLTIAQGFRGIFMPGASGDVFIENVTFDGPTYTFNSDAGNKNYGVYLSNCTIKGWTSHSDVHKEVVYTNCTFGERGNKFCRPYGPTTFVGCDFCEGYEIDARGEATFVECKLNGVVVTPANLTTLVTGNSANASVADVNGNRVVWNELKDVAASCYEGDLFTGGYMEGALWINKYNFGGDAAIVLEKETYKAIIVENSIGAFKNDVITINSDNNSVVVLQNLDLTLAEGKKLIKAAENIYQVFMANITINGVKMTQDTIAKYLENVAWYQVVEEI